MSGKFSFNITIQLKLENIQVITKYDVRGSYGKTKKTLIFVTYRHEHWGHLNTQK